MKKILLSLLCLLAIFPLSGCLGAPEAEVFAFGYDHPGGEETHVLSCEAGDELTISATLQNQSLRGFTILHGYSIVHLWLDDEDQVEVSIGIETYFFSGQKIIGERTVLFDQPGVHTVTVSTSFLIDGEPYSFSESVEITVTESPAGNG
jgi:hypothetical protein